MKTANQSRRTNLRLNDECLEYIATEARRQNVSESFFLRNVVLAHKRIAGYTRKLGND